MKPIHTFVILAYKESQYLEDCIKSVVNQSIKSNVVIATTTNNNFIKELAKKYNLKIKVGNHTTIGGDFDFAIDCCDSKLVTIAHQDDIYEKNYLENIIDNYKKYNDSIILFTDYYEIKNKDKVVSNKLLKIKRFLLLPLYCKKTSNLKFNKRAVICMGNAICCPSVTFVKKNITKQIFTSDFICNVDWNAWEKLSKLNGRFIYIRKQLMGHRVHAESTTSQIIKSNTRTIEDYKMFQKFWPKWIAKILNKLYKKSEKSNFLIGDKNEKNNN